MSKQPGKNNMRIRIYLHMLLRSDWFREYYNNCLSRYSYSHNTMNVWRNNSFCCVKKGKLSFCSSTIWFWFQRNVLVYILWTLRLLISEDSHYWLNRLQTLSVSPKMTEALSPVQRWQLCSQLGTWYSRHSRQFPLLCLKFQILKFKLYRMENAKF